jgi:hypothetical protein
LKLNSICRKAAFQRTGGKVCGLVRPGGLRFRFFHDHFHFFTAVLAFKSAHLSL